VTFYCQGRLSGSNLSQQAFASQNFCSRPPAPLTHQSLIMLASILSKVSPWAARAVSAQPLSVMATRDIATKANKTSKLKAKLKVKKRSPSYSHSAPRYYSLLTVFIHRNFVSL
jgi:hypothetical protein